MSTITVQGMLPSEFISSYKTDLVFKQIKRYKDKINQEWDEVIHDFLKLDYETENLIYAFVSFVEQDIDIGQEFNHYCYRNDPKAIKKIECRICTIINPLVYLPVDKIGKGHKAICVLQFNPTTKERFQLPVIDGFHMNKNGNEVILFNE
ncbi:hypothetical protein PAECIP111891_06013 [Paenibacillus allorhizoplanae]|uniref:Uncharacterized protein n=1 Tax=Paenibacillus allorhizoplanae TaxID=2905648 RepID=A0ABN8H870_9BACL|nr:hypothetical protein [Paenibacillus allorhizoplanae]CAH1226852.1 hypothetical protein PAECIP111891_06013 [Paenibacillus allorhizoplanae]